MGKSQKAKGTRREREFAALIGGSRRPLSGACKGYKNDVEGLGWEWEVKARKDGFKTLYNWLLNDSHPDALALKADRKPWLVVMTLEKFLELIESEQKDREISGIVQKGEQHE